MRCMDFPSSPLSENPELSMMTCLIPLSAHCCTNWGTTLAGVMITARSTVSGYRSLQRILAPVHGFALRFTANTAPSQDEISFRALQMVAPD